MEIAQRMIEITKTVGRLLAVLVHKGIITKDEADYILEPLKEAENE